MSWERKIYFLISEGDTTLRQGSWPRRIYEYMVENGFAEYPEGSWQRRAFFALEFPANNIGAWWRRFYQALSEGQGTATGSWQRRIYFWIRDNGFGEIPVNSWRYFQTEVPTTWDELLTTTWDDLVI